MVVLNHNETHTYDNLLKFTPVSSGFHIGAANWSMEAAQTRISIVTNASVGIDYRHPMPFKGELLNKCDCMIISSVVLNKDRLPFDQQMQHLLEKLQESLHANMNSKVLMPVQPQFALEIVDLLLHKLDERIKIVFMSDAANALLEYANINLEYLNPMLQGKIYNTENPLSFDKLINSGRMVIFKDIQEYLNSKKSAGSIDTGLFSFNEIERELLICSHQSMRLGDSVYWLHNLNKHSAVSSSLILTDPYLIDNPLLMKPFQNRLKVHYCPINPAVNFDELNKIINWLQPKHIISPYTVEEIKLSYQGVVTDTISSSQTLTLDES